MTQRLLTLEDERLTLTRLSLGKDRGRAIQLDLENSYIQLDANDCARVANVLSAFVHAERTHRDVSLGYPPALTIERVQLLNRVRADRWHNGDFRNWTILEWAGAMCGEAGEAANVAKKIRRYELALSGNESSERKLTTAELSDALARELADTFLYLCLVAERGGVSLADAVRAVFNAKSDEMQFPERL